MPSSLWDWKINLQHAGIINKHKNRKTRNITVNIILILMSDLQKLLGVFLREITKRCEGRKWVAVHFCNWVECGQVKQM